MRAVGRRRHGQSLAGAAVLVCILTYASSALAHALRERFDPPIPLSLYLAGAGATVALSFAVIARLARGASRHAGSPPVNLLRFGMFRAIAHPGVLRIWRLLAVAVFALILLAGSFGEQNAFKNIAPTAVWVIWWVGMAYISALFGDFWRLLNPWNILFTWAEELQRRWRGGRLSFDLPYPQWLGVWPAVLLFLGFAWAELIWEHAEVPESLARAILSYSVLTWTGMLVFGRERWLESGEVFTVFFGTLGCFAPMAFRAAGADRVWELRPYGAGLMLAEPVHSSRMVFVLLMLSTVTFDGCIETPAWTAFVDRALSAPALIPLWSILHQALGNLLPVMNTLGLVLFPLLFVAVYLVVIRLMARSAAASGDGAGRITASELARLFIFTLVPIAIAYHLAHYLAYFLVAGQFIIPLASDPFGFGWDLLGTTLYRIDIGIVDARFIWYTAVFAIVAGHVIAVGLAHRMALRIYQDPRTATRSQYPMLVLMVGYTMLSLWILAQPVVDTGVP